MPEPQQKLRYTMVFDANTKELKVVNTHLEDTEKKGKKAAKAVGGIGTSASGIANIIAGIGIGAFLFDTMKRAIAGTNAMNELKETFDETAGVVVTSLEPAIKLMSKGLQGLLLTVQGLVKAFRKVIGGDFQGALDEMLDAIAAAGERAQGLTRATERVQSKIILEEAKIRVRDVRLSGEEKVKIVKEAEAKALHILRTSGEFALLSQTQKAKAELEIRKEISTEIEAAERERATQEMEQAQASIDLLRLKLVDETTTHEERLAMLEEIHERELELIEARASGVYTSEETLAARRLKAHQSYINARAKLNTTRLKNDEKQARAELKMQMDNLKASTALDAQAIQSMAAAAAQELQISGNAANAARAGGAQAVRDAANWGAKQIAVQGAIATAKAFARGGGFPTGIPFAVATAAVYASLAAVVSAAGGAVAAAIAPPSGGGAMGPSATELAPAPEVRVSPVGGGMGGGAYEEELPMGAELGAPPEMEAVGTTRVTIINYGEFPAETVEDLAMKVADRARR